MKKYILFLFFLTISFNTVADVKIEFLNSNSPSKYDTLLNITGEIKKSDVDFIKNFLKDYTTDQISVIVGLDSAGGSLSAAIEIGRILRKYNAVSVMAEEQICHSACVFVIAGTPKRAINGKVGIHRPYLVQDNQTTVSGQKKQKEKIDKFALEYLKEMNVSDTLYKDMLRISPVNLKILSKDDLITYGLGSTDPYYEDAENARHAKNLGISTGELIKRKGRAKSICNLNDPVEDVFKCREEVIDKGNFNYLPHTKILGTSNQSDKDKMIVILDKLRPNWREIATSKNFKEWTKTLSDSAKLNESWDPYFVNEKIQQYLDQVNVNAVSKSPVRLSCIVSNTDLIIEVDLKNSTVNGINARIDENFIQYAPNGLDITINRVSGSILVAYVPPYSKNGIPLSPSKGQCKKVDANSF